MRRKMKGFTLLEVVIALVIVAILAAGTLPALSNINKQSFQTEIDLNLPSVGQAALNGQSSATSLYADLTDTTTRSVSLLTNELVKHSATVSSKGYTYAIDTLYADVGVGLGSLSSTQKEETGETTASTISEVVTSSGSFPVLTRSTVWDSTTCHTNGSLQNSSNDYLTRYGDPNSPDAQYLAIFANGDGVIRYGLTFWVPDEQSGKKVTVKVAVPRNTLEATSTLEDNSSAKPYSYVVYRYKNLQGNTSTINPPSSLPDVCTLGPKDTGQGNGGTKYFNQGSASTSSIIDYYDFDSGQTGKEAWNMQFSVKFAEGTASSDQWVLIFIPSSAGEEIGDVQSIITSTVFNPYSFSVYHEVVDGLLAWDSVTFDISENASVKVEVKTDSMSWNEAYVFHATGPANQMKISLRQYDLPLETLEVKFTVSSIDNRRPANVNNVGIFYWQTESP